MSLFFFNKKADFSAFLPQLTLEQLAPYLDQLIQEVLKTSSFTKTHITQSTFHHVFHIITSKQEVFLKVAKYSELQMSLDLEATLYHQRINALGIGIAILAVDVTHQKYPFAYLFLEKAAGVCLRTISIDDPNYAHFVEHIGHTLARVHHTPLNHYGYGLIASVDNNTHYYAAYDTWWHFLNDHFETHLTTIAEGNLISTNECGWFEQCQQQLFSHLSTRSSVSLLHGDPGSHNIYVNPTNHTVTTLLDWEDIMVGDPLFELAMFLSFYRMDEFITPLIKGYQQINAILKKPEKYQLLWLYYLRIVLAKGALRIKLGYDTDSISPTLAKIQLAKQHLGKLR